MQNLVSKVPIMVVEGNHEIEKQARDRTFVAYSSRFAFPSKESGSSSTFYYSFNAGGIHFIMLGAYINYDKTGIFPFTPFHCTVISAILIYLGYYLLSTDLFGILLNPCFGRQARVKIN